METKKTIVEEIEQLVRDGRHACAASGRNVQTVHARSTPRSGRVFVHDNGRAVLNLGYDLTPARSIFHVYTGAVRPSDWFTVTDSDGCTRFEIANDEEEGRKVLLDYCRNLITN